MRFSSSLLAPILLAALATACGSEDPGLFGESNGSGGGGTGSGDGGSATTSGQPAGPTTTSTSTGDGGAPAGPSSSSSAQGGSSSVSSVGPGPGPASSSSVTTGALSSSAAGPTCGNGIADGTEDCDVFDLDGETCSTLGLGAGFLACADDCTFDTSGCSTSSCGNGDLEALEECDDGGNDPGDGCDQDCNFEGTSCEDPIEVAIDRGDVVTIATTNAGGDDAPGVCYDATGPGRAFHVVPGDDGFLRVWLKRAGTTFDSSLRIGFSCDDTFVCADSYDTANIQLYGGGEVGSLSVDEGQDVFVFVEGWNPQQVGDFEVEMTLTRGRCSEPVDVPLEVGSSEAIALWGFNGEQEAGVSGTCGGVGRDVAYRVRAIDTYPEILDATLDVVPNFSFNPVLHARVGACNLVSDQVSCSNANGSGQSETIGPFSFENESAWIFADSTTLASGGNGGYVLHVRPTTN